MANRFLETLVTPAVRRAQMHYYGKERPRLDAPERDPLGDDERAFIDARDSFYLATVSENGWPYVQHRGGARGFLRVVDPTLLGFADYRGNRQLLSTGNLAVNDRVTLFLMDYPNRTRLKIIGHARVEDAKEHAERFATLAGTEGAQMPRCALPVSFAGGKFVRDSISGVARPGPAGLLSGRGSGGKSLDEPHDGLL